ncbi:MAG: hypothetical protein SFW35_08625 [Chitinophagales bacterium]|nr:hypothetical protein [Chitinophagales bacterium]
MPFDIIEQRKYLWEFFSYHASQRLNTFNFYLILSGAVITGIFTADAKEQSVVSLILSLILSLISFIFQKLDSRNKRFIKLSEKGLMDIEDRIDYGEFSDIANDIKIITSIEQYTKKENVYFTYSKCFTIIFGVFFLLGIFYALSIINQLVCKC